MARTSCPTLRSRNESGSQLVSPGSLDEPVEHHPEMGEDVARIIVWCGDFFVILGDSLEGYYLVKCLSTNADTFSGTYFELSSEKVPNKVIFSDTHKGDTFYKRTVVSQISVTRVSFDKRTSLLAVDKNELDDILLTISEMGDI